MEGTDSEIKNLDFIVEVFANLLKQQDINAVIDCEQKLIDLLGYEKARKITNKAILQVSELSPQTGSWICKNFPDFEACIELKEYSVMLATRQLINKGFILGKDFSATAEGKLVINRKAKIGLLQRLYLWEQVWVESVLVVED
ncbi:MAG: hypothetical protein WBF90_20455 [Rivularia sp. (in: cyanobacteria)]